MVVREPSGEGGPRPLPAVERASPGAHDRIKPALTAPIRSEDWIDTRILFAMALRRWRLIAYAFLLLAPIVALALLSAERKFTAHILLYPNAEGVSLEGMVGLNFKLPGLSSLGLGGKEGVQPFDLFTEALKSHAVAEALAKEDWVMKTIYAQEWNKAKGEWQRPGGLKMFVKTVMSGMAGRAAWLPPSASRLQFYMKNRVALAATGKSGVHLLSFSHADPAFAGRFLEAVRRATDDLVRQQTVTRSAEQIQYLRSKLATVTVADHRTALTQLLSDSEKKMMLASTNLPYAAQVLDGPHVSEQPTSPNMVMSFVLALPIAALIAIVIGVGYDVARSQGWPDKLGHRLAGYRRTVANIKR